MSSIILYLFFYLVCISLKTIAKSVGEDYCASVNLTLTSFSCKIPSSFAEAIVVDDMGIDNEGHRLIKVFSKRLETQIVSFLLCRHSCSISLITTAKNYNYDILYF